MAKRITDDQLIEEVKRIGYDKAAQYDIAKRYNLSVSRVNSRISELKIQDKAPDPTEHETRVQENYKVHILKSFLDKLGIDAGTYVNVTLENDRLIIQKV